MPAGASHRASPRGSPLVAVACQRRFSRSGRDGVRRSHAAALQLLRRVPFWAVQSLVDLSLQLPGFGLFSESVGRTDDDLDAAPNWRRLIGPCTGLSATRPVMTNHRVRVTADLEVVLEVPGYLPCSALTSACRIKLSSNQQPCLMSTSRDDLILVDFIAASYSSCSFTVLAAHTARPVDYQSALPWHASFGDRPHSTTRAHFVL